MTFTMRKMSLEEAIKEAEETYPLETNPDIAALLKAAKELIKARALIKSIAESSPYGVPDGGLMQNFCRKYMAENPDDP